MTPTTTTERLYYSDPLTNPVYLGVPPPMHTNMNLKSERVVKITIGEDSFNKMMVDLLNQHNDMAIIYRHENLRKMYSELRMMMELYK